MKIIDNTDNPNDAVLHAETAGELSFDDYTIAPEDEELAREIENFSIEDVPTSYSTRGNVRLPETLKLTALPPQLRQSVEAELVGVPEDRRPAVEAELVLKALRGNRQDHLVRHGPGPNADHYQVEFFAVAGEAYSLGQELIDIGYRLADVARTEPQYDKVVRHVSGIMTRLVPLGGQSRQVNDMLHGSAVEAVTLTDQMLRTIPGAGLYQPVRRDILGYPVKGRTFGIAVGDSGSTDGVSISPVKAKLRDLGFSIRNLKRTDPSGFGLTAKQLDRLRELRGKVAVDDTGSTMTQALERLFDDRWFNDLPSKEQKRDVVMEVITSFSGPARELLTLEDRDYAASVMGHIAFKQYVRDGYSHMGAVEAAEADVTAMGLPDPKLRNFADWLREQ